MSALAAILPHEEHRRSVLDLAGARVAVTGASGFLGSHLVRALRAAGADVLPLVRRQDARAPAGSQILAEVLSAPGALGGTDVLVHAAAVRHRHGAAAAEYDASNVRLLETLLRASQGHVARFVHVSSVGVYGFPEDLPIDETFPFAPRTLYSATKVTAERRLRSLGAELGVPWVLARPTIVYGPGDRGGMFDKLVSMLSRGTYRLVGDGKNVLHHTHVDDMTHGLAVLARSPGALGEDFILAGPEKTTLARLSEQAADALGVELPRLGVPLRVARGCATVVGALERSGLAFGRREPPLSHEKLDVMTVSTAFSTHKAQSIGFRPRVAYDEGIRRTVAELGRGPVNRTKVEREAFA